MTSGKLLANSRQHRFPKQTHQNTGQEAWLIKLSTHSIHIKTKPNKGQRNNWQIFSGRNRPKKSITLALK